VVGIPKSVDYGVNEALLIVTEPATSPHKQSRNLIGLCLINNCSMKISKPHQGD
jgi:hypothetical protein